MGIAVGIIIGIFGLMFFLRAEKKWKDYSKSQNKKPERKFVMCEEVDGKLIPYQKPAKSKRRKK